jgi:hypothetical protein
VGLAVCPSLGLLFTSCDNDSTISAFALEPPVFPRLGVWGGRGFGPLLFWLAVNDAPAGEFALRWLLAAPAATSRLLMPLVARCGCLFCVRIPAPGTRCDCP